LIDTPELQLGGLMLVPVEDGTMLRCHRTGQYIEITNARAVVRGHKMYCTRELYQRLILRNTGGTA